jgi:DNA-binding transcriptional regulator YiaG
MTNTIDFASLVKELRQAKGLTQEEFAAALDVTVGILSSWENGHHRPVKAQRKRLLRLASKAGIQPPLAPSSPASGNQR